MFHHRSHPRLESRGVPSGRRSNRSITRLPVEPLEGRTLFAAGDLDPTFGFAGVASADVPGSHIEIAHDVAVRNGRVVVAGTTFTRSATGANEVDGVALAVFDSAGKPLTSFSGDGVERERLSVRGGALAVAVQSDNKILVIAGDNFTAFGPLVLARFNANGTLDTTFGGGDGQLNLSFGSPIFGAKLALAPGGKVVVAGVTSDWRIGVARFTATGAPDGQFVADVSAASGAWVSDVAVQGDGKVVVAGGVGRALPPDAPQRRDPAVLRFNANLSGLDMTFGGGDGIATFATDPEETGFDRVDAMTLDPAGRIVAAVRLNQTSVHRLLTDGSPDPSFTVTPVPSELRVEDIAVAPNDGKIVVSGDNSGNFGILARLNANGGIDTGFGGGDGFVQDEDTLGQGSLVAGPQSAVQPDGRIISAGYSERTSAGAILTAHRHLAENSTPVGSVVLGADKVLRVTGTEFGDEIQLRDPGSAESHQEYTVVLNRRLFSFRRIDVARVEVAALGGNDLVTTRLAGVSDYVPQRLDGGKGNDELRGGLGNDRLLGMDGNDRIFGEAGDDTVDGGLGTDLMDGGTGADTADYSFRSAALFVDLQGDADDGASGERDTVAANVEHILGGSGNDTLTGNALPNFIRGNGGNDTIRGGAGNDNLIGDGGQDRVYGEAGDDFLEVRDGITDLVLDGGTGFDRAKKDGSDPRTSIEQLV